jgi:cellulose synthase operon protein YhjU
MATEPASPTSPPPTASTTAIRLGPWSLYFLIKLALFWKELISFHADENLAFAAFLLVPAKSEAWRRTKVAVAVPAAIALLYHESWLPPASRVFSQASLLASFNFGYFAELLGRFISWPIVMMLVAIWAGYQLLARWVRLGVLVMGALLVLALMQQQPPSHSAGMEVAQAKPGGAAGQADSTPQSLNAALQAFYASESRRAVTFPSPAADAAPFDILFVHVCSLSWDDILAVGLDKHPLWQHFDMVLTRFNSASSYSGPAAVRIMKATCGQPSHAALYEPAPANCYLMNSLQRSGFEPNLLMNHDGHFDDFLKLVQNQGKLSPPPLPLGGVQVTQHAFDGAPIYNDLAVLSRWLDKRQADTAPRVAAYYNTISLHDGNHLEGVESKRDSLETYRPRAARLFDDLELFMQKIETSGRRAVVIMVPEHGAALRGDKMQIPGLREIPSPAITEVPVGIRVIGPQLQREGETLRVEASTSYLAVSQIVAELIKKSPFDDGRFMPSDYIQNLPTTDFVSENEGTVVMRRSGNYFLRLGKDDWSAYAVSPQSSPPTDPQKSLPPAQP